MNENGNSWLNQRTIIFAGGIIVAIIIAVQIGGKLDRHDENMSEVFREFTKIAEQINEGQETVAKGQLMLADAMRSLEKAITSNKQMLQIKP